MKWTFLIEGIIMGVSFVTALLFWVHLIFLHGIN